MSNDFKSIHEFDFTLICNYFKALKRQGPGSPEVTQPTIRKDKLQVSTFSPTLSSYSTKMQ